MRNHDVTKTEQPKASKTAIERYFRKYGFGRWVDVLRGAIEKQKGCGKNLPSGSDTPWTTMSVTTMNYGNEDHVDGGDHCQGITIWHESNPPTVKQSARRTLKGWYFLFPNMEVRIGEEWKKGVAVRLQHGTVVTWDARLIRHCTSLPCLQFNKKKDKIVSMTHGTYFGIDKRIANWLKREQENKKRKR